MRKNIFCSMLFFLFLTVDIFAYNADATQYFKNATFSEIIRFDPLLFKDDKIQEENKDSLDEIVQEIKTYIDNDKNVAITIVGHTSSYLDKIYKLDNQNANLNEEKNRLYSQKVQEYFLQNGIDSKKIFINYNADKKYSNGISKRENLSNMAIVTMYVKENLDIDNDGVPNVTDQCPDTKAGNKVGVNGCSIKTMVVLLEGKKEHSAVIVNTKAGNVKIDTPNQIVSIQSKDLKPSLPIDIGIDELNALLGNILVGMNKEELQYVLYFNGNNLTADSTKEFDLMIEEMAKRGKVYIKIIGHTDTVGNSRGNYTVSKSRAKIISNMIKKSDTQYYKIDLEPYGESNLAIPTKDEVFEPLNRRVEIFIN